MNKAEFISAVADEAGSSKSDASAHVEAMINVVTNALKGDNEVTLVIGFCLPDNLVLQFCVGSFL